MIKGFTKGIYKILAKAALGCLVVATVVLANGINVKAFASDNLLNSANEGQQIQSNSNQFLIDEEIKCFDNIAKVRKYAGFDFKLPDYLGESKWNGGYQLLKISDTDNALLMYYDDEGYKDFGFSLVIFKDNPIESLKKVLELKGSLPKIYNAECEDSEQEANYGGVRGKDITLLIKTPEQTMGKYTIPESVDTVKYFVWNDNNVYYAINYNHSIEENGHKGSWIDISQDEAGKIADSFKNIDSIKNVDYKKEFIGERELSTETGIMTIYDKDDLKEAEKILGFNPKMPLRINDNILIDGSSVGITGDSDVENNKINYELNLFYNYGKNRITFNQSSHDSFNDYKKIKENGYVDKSYYEDADVVSKKINADSINVDGKIVYKYIESFADTDNSKLSSDVHYEWEENGIYCSLSLFNTDTYKDDIAKEFINSKTID